MPTADGEDISPLLHGEDREIHKIGVTENPWSKAVLKGAWRLVYYPRGFFKRAGENHDFGELYNLADDPWEMQNLYFDPRLSRQGCGVTARSVRLAGDNDACEDRLAADSATWKADPRECQSGVLRSARSRRQAIVARTGSAGGRL